MRLRTTAAVAATLACCGVAFAGPTTLPPGVFPGEPGVAGATAGSYAIDPSHTAVIAKVSHIGYAFSVFRFDKVEGTLTWDPDEPARSSLTATVDVASIDTPVAGFAKELAGKDYLNAEAFPKASFVATSFRPINGTHGMVEGNFTLLGQTHPISFVVVLEGAGRGFMGHPRIGVQATTQIDPRSYGLSPMFALPIQLEIDAEFEKS